MSTRYIIMWAVLLLLLMPTCKKEQMPFESKETDTIIPITQAVIDSSFSDTVVIIITEDTTIIEND